MCAKDNRTYYADMAAPRRHNRQSAVWLLLLLLCLGGAWLGQNRLGGQSAPVNNVLSNADGIIQSVQPSGKWPSRLMADSEALFAWRRYQQDLAEAAAEIRVAVYCTHSSETYTSYSGQPKVYGELGGIYQAAHAFADTLQAEGVGVLVNETIHDWPDWNKAYANSLATAEGLLAAYPNLQVLIDWHRDAGVSREASVVDINGRTAARIMLVMKIPTGIATAILCSGWAIRWTNYILGCCGGFPCRPGAIISIFLTMPFWWRWAVRKIILRR